jgi:hypothetical protein
MSLASLSTEYVSHPVRIDACDSVASQSVHKYKINLVGANLNRVWTVEVKMRCRGDRGVRRVTASDAGPNFVGATSVMRCRTSDDLTVVHSVARACTTFVSIFSFYCN